MKDASFYKRMKASARDFEKGLKRPMEEQLGAEILPIESLPSTKLVSMIDFAGVDAYVMNEADKEMIGLASRVNYRWFKDTPSFSFRFALWDKTTNDWTYEREYKRKLAIANQPIKFVFPELHIESFSTEEGSGNISWAIMARTQHILNYIDMNITRKGADFIGKNGVQIKEPHTKERRLVVSVSGEALKDYTKVKHIKVNN